MPKLQRTRALLLALGLAACRREAEPITEPRQLGESPFRYPEELWDASVEGQTIVRLYITAAGQVDSVRVEKSSGHAAFDSAAVAGARQLRFQPARQGEEPIAVWRSLPVEFELGSPADSAATPNQTP